MSSLLRSQSGHWLASSQWHPADSYCLLSRVLPKDVPKARPPLDLAVTITMTADLETRVRAFVGEYVDRERKSITDRTTLYGDLGIYGDEAIDLFEDFRQLFHVDCSELQLSRHFDAEGIPVWFPICWLTLVFCRGTPEERRGFEPICVSDLIAAAKCGKWQYK